MGFKYSDFESIDTRKTFLFMNVVRYVEYKMFTCMEQKKFTKWLSSGGFR